MLEFLLFAWLSAPPLVPQSPEAWRYAVTQGSNLISAVYEQTPEGLVCQQTSQLDVIKTLENVATEKDEHPARIAEELVVYLWNDWTLLHVTGYDIRQVVEDEVFESIEHKKVVTGFLEQFYQEHHVCLLGILKVLVYGYEKNYQLLNSKYVRTQEALGERYEPLALEPKYFPGTGILEPLGLVYAVKLGDFLTMAWLRETALELITETLQRRAKRSGDPLKVQHPSQQD
jgi:hypothetical protein